MADTITLQREAIPAQWQAALARVLVDGLRLKVVSERLGHKDITTPLSADAAALPTCRTTQSRCSTG
jgi:hypothetical protein